MLATGRQQVYELCAAYAQGRLESVFDILDDDVDFISYAPIEVFPCLSRRRGKDALGDRLRSLHAQFDVLSHQPISMVIQDAGAAVMIRSQLKQRATGRTIHLTLAWLLRFRNRRIVEVREFMDTFSAVEQVFGRKIEIAAPGNAEDHVP